MTKRRWLLTALLAVPLIGAGLAYAGGQYRGCVSPEKTGFVCPLTGENLPCPNCCPTKGQ